MEMLFYPSELYSADEYDASYSQDSGKRKADVAT